MRQAILVRLWPRIESTQANQWLTALGVGIAACMLAIGGLVLVDLRADAWRQAEQASSNLVLAMTRDIARNITLYDLSIQGVCDAMQRPDILSLDPDIRQMVLFDRATSAEFLGSLVVLDPNGDIVADSTAISPHKMNFADREHFSIQRDNPDIGLFLSHPYKSRLRGGDPSIAISRRLSRPDGSFAGVVVGTLRLAYFSNLFAKLDLGSAGSVTLFRSDGRVIMRRPYREQDIDRDLGATNLFRRYLQSEAGVLAGTAALDGVQRLYAFRHVPGLPMILSVAVGLDDVYAPWRRKAMVIAAVLSLLCGMTIAMSVLFRREIVRRIHAETGLREAVDRMAVIATTDVLTGLSNRRAFEDRLAQEWLRAIRNQTPIALLMLDADYFKRFNDRYGHPAGDGALRSIAEGIACNVMRPGDLGARYGGEEFTVLLPDTECTGALVVGERIRAAVEALDIPHEGHPNRHVTVSIGLAVAYPMPGDSSATLVSLADAALYEAKRNGRNRVSGIGIDSLPVAGAHVLDDPSLR